MRPFFALLGTAAVLSLAAGCTLNTDYFGEYRGKNLLGNYDFGAAGKWALTSDPTMVKDNGAAYAPANFMTWEPVTGIPSPDGASPVYRLEIKNLIPDGDFEADAEGATTLPSHWTHPDVSGTASPSTVVLATNHSTSYGTLSLTGRSLWWDAKSSGNQLFLNLTTAAGTASWIKATYHLRFDFRNPSSVANLAVYLTDGTGAKIENMFTAANVANWAGNDLDHTSVYALSRTFSTETAADGRRLLLGPRATEQGTYAAIVDSVKLFPDSKYLAVEAVLPKLNSGTLPLLPGSKPGMYTLSFFVRGDAAAGTANRFAAKALTVQMVGKVKSGTGNPTYLFKGPWGASAWTPIVVNLGFDFVNSDDAQAGNALTIRIAPTDTVTNDSIDAGSLLVTQPVLTFNP